MKRTNHSIILNLDEIKHLYSSKVNIDALPETMEILEDGIHIASYLSDEEFKKQEGILFPRCPITGAFGSWGPRSQ